jgi:hypothetical protein
MLSLTKGRSAIGTIWILVHTIMFLAGVIIFQVPAITNLLGPIFAQALGGGLAATGAAGIFVFLYIKKSERLSSSMSMFLDGGVIALFEGRAARIKEEYDRRLTRFSNLDVIGCGLSSFREDYKTDFIRWSSHATVRILLLDPEFPSERNSFANLRDHEEQNHEGKISADVRQFVEEVESLLGETEKFQIRLMRCTPSVNIFRVPGQIAKSAVGTAL